MECKIAAETIKRNLNQNIDPCFDFYQFACGGFSRWNPVSTSHPHVDAFDQLEQQTRDRVSYDLLDNHLLHHHGSKAVEAVMKIYDDCVILKDQDSCFQSLINKYPHIIERIYVDKYFDDEDQHKSRDIMSKIWKEMLDSIKNIHWIDEDIKRHVENKFSSLEIRSGYPDWILNDKELDQEYPELLTKSNKTSSYQRHPHWTMGALDVNTTFDGSAIYIPAGILHGIIFGKSVPDSVNYGGAGFIAAHELATAAQSWIRDTMKGDDAMTSHVSKCVKDQVESMKEHQTGLSYNNLPTDFVNELINDIGAANATIVAMMKQEKLSHIEKRLHGLSSFSSAQLVFLQQANVWCGSSTDAYVRSFMKEGIKTGRPYNAYRINVHAMNSPNFGSAFKCKVGSVMNPRNKCIVW